MPRIRDLTVWTLVLLALAPRPLRADALESGDGVRNLLRYGSCAASVFVANSPGHWLLAFASCALLYHDAA